MHESEYLIDTKASTCLKTKNHDTYVNIYVCQQLRFNKEEQPKSQIRVIFFQKRI